MNLGHIGKVNLSMFLLMCLCTIEWHKDNKSAICPRILCQFDFAAFCRHWQSVADFFFFFFFFLRAFPLKPKIFVPVPIYPEDYFVKKQPVLFMAFLHYQDISCCTFTIKVDLTVCFRCISIIGLYSTPDTIYLHLCYRKENSNTLL